MSFPAIEQRCNEPHQEDRRRNEIEEIFTDCFAWQIEHGRTHTKEPAEEEKEWRRQPRWQCRKCETGHRNSNANAVAISAKSAKVQMDAGPPKAGTRQSVTTARPTDMMKGNPWR